MSTASNNRDIEGAAFTRVMGTGGIGTGLFFVTDDNRTLGRSESRLVTLTDAKDYCKLHIVFHYIAKMLTFGKQDQPEQPARPGQVSRLQVLPIGCVGQDASGAQLIKEMQQSGMDTSFVASSSDLPTPISICLQYPDKEGCNFTAQNGAAQAVTPAFIEEALHQLSPDQSTILMAIPEVALESRETLLKIGREKGCFNILSYVALEAPYVKEHQWLAMADLVSVNEEEALSLLEQLNTQTNTQELQPQSSLPADNDPADPLLSETSSPEWTVDTEESLIRSLFAYASSLNPDISLIMTCGKDGAFVCNAGGLEHLPPFPAAVVNTTGAGDAFIGGTTAALAMGYPLLKGKSDDHFGQTPLMSAPEFGSLCAGLAVEEADSIALHVTKENIRSRLESLEFTHSFDKLI